MPLFLSKSAAVFSLDRLFAMQVNNDVVDLVVAQTPIESGHRPLSVNDDLPDRFVCRLGRAIGEIVMRKKSMKLGRNLDQPKLVLFMTLVAIERIESSSSLLGRTERL
jgi:hypothetical protein